MPAPPLQGFVDLVGPPLKSAWLNPVDSLVTTIFEQNTPSKPTARQVLTNDAPFEVANGGTGVRTLGALSAALGLNTAYGTDSGVVNAYVFTHAGAVAATLTVGELVRFTPLNTNNSASTLNADGTGALNILRASGSPLTGGELSSLGPVVLQYTGAAWQIVSTAGAQPGFERQNAETANLIIPVDYTQLPGAAARYGAKGDNITDDSTAFAAAALVSGTFPIILIHTTYLVNTPFVLPSGGSIFTDSRKATIRTAVAGNHIVSAVGQNNLTLYSVNLQGANSQTHPLSSIGGFQTSSTGLATFVNCTNVRAYDCEFSLFASGLVAINCNKVFFTHNFIHNWCYYGILGSGSTEASFDFNVMDTCDLTTIVTFTGAPAAGATSGTIVPPWPGATSTYAVSFIETAGGSVELRGVTLTNGATTATWALGLAANCNAQTDGSSYGISCTGSEATGLPSKGVSISFNRIWHVQAWAGIMSHDMNGLTLLGNDIRDVRNGIDLSSPSGNNFLRNCLLNSNYIEGTNQDVWNGVSASHRAISLFGFSGAITFTGAPAANATSATLNAVWPNKTGVYTVQFTETVGGLFELRQVTLTNNQTTATWTSPLSAACNAAATYVSTFDTATVVGNTCRNFGNMVETNQTFNISGISQAANAVVTINQVSTANPIAVGASVYLNGVAGMTQINGTTAIVRAIGGVSGAWTLTIPVTSTSFTPWSSGGTAQVDGFAISAISQAASGVVTINSQNAINPIANGSTLYFQNIGGMTQLNGQTGTVTAVGGVAGAWTATFNINTSVMSAYTSGGEATQGAPTLSNAAVVMTQYLNDYTYSSNIIEGIATIANPQALAGLYMVGTINNGVLLGNVFSGNFAAGAIRSVGLAAGSLVVDDNLISLLNPASIAIQLGNTTQIGYGGGTAGGLKLGSNPTNSNTPFFGAGTLVLAPNNNCLKGQATFAAAATVAVVFANGLQMPNANYQVAPGNNAAGFCWATAKTTAGFTLNCSAVNSNVTDWQVSS